MATRTKKAAAPAETEQTPDVANVTNVTNVTNYEGYVLSAEAAEALITNFNAAGVVKDGDRLNLALDGNRVVVVAEPVEG